MARMYEGKGLMPFKSDRKLVGRHFMMSVHSVLSVTRIHGCYCQRGFTRNSLDCFWAKNICSACWFEVIKNPTVQVAMMSSIKCKIITQNNFVQRRLMANLTDFEVERNSQMSRIGDSLEQILSLLKQLIWARSARCKTNSASYLWPSHSCRHKRTMVRLEANTKTEEK